MWGVPPADGRVFFLYPRLTTNFLKQGVYPPLTISPGTRYRLRMHVLYMWGGVTIYRFDEGKGEGFLYSWSNSVASPCLY